MKSFILCLFFLLSTSVLADTYCRDFREIKSTMVKLDKHKVDEIIPRADWLDEKYRLEDRKKMINLTAKTVVLALLKRLSFYSYIFEPTRAGVSSMTGYYVSSPDNFVRFLALEEKTACFYLGLHDVHAQILRKLTWTVALELRNAQ